LQATHDNAQTASLILGNRSYSWRHRRSAYTRFQGWRAFSPEAEGARAPTPTASTLSQVVAKRSAHRARPRGLVTL